MAISLFDRAPRLALASKIQSLCSKELYFLANISQNIPSAVETLEILCRAMYEAIQASDAELENALCDATAFFAISCDTGAGGCHSSQKQEQSKAVKWSHQRTHEPPQEGTPQSSLDNFDYKQSWKIQPSAEGENELNCGLVEYRYCAALMRHCFSAISQLADVPKSQSISAYIKLTWTIFRHFLPTNSDGSSREHNNMSKNERAVLQIVHSARQASSGVTEGIVAILVSQQTRHDIALACACLDVLHTFVSYASMQPTIGVNIDLNTLLQQLCYLKSVDTQERMINLVRSLLASFDKPRNGKSLAGEGVAEDSQVRETSRCTARKTSACELPLDVQKSVFAEACKNCIMSRSQRILLSLLELLQVVSESSKLQHLVPFLGNSGFLDYVFESVRMCTVASTTAGESEEASAESKLVTLGLKIMAYMLERVPDRFEDKWSYGLSIVLRAAERYSEQNPLGLVFSIIRAASAASHFSVFSVKNAQAILSLFSMCGSKYGFLSTSGGKEVSQSKVEFEIAVGAIEQLAGKNAFPVDVHAQLLDCVECAVTLLPCSPPCTRLFRHVINTFADNSRLPEYAELFRRLRELLLLFEKEIARPAFRLPLGQMNPELQCEFVYTLGSGLDQRLYRYCPPQQYQETIEICWGDLSPKLLLDQLDAQVGEFKLEDTEKQVPCNQTSGESPRELSASGKKCLHKGNAVCGGSACAVQIYLARLCCFSELFQFDSEFQVRDLLSHIPTSSTMCRNYLNCDLDTFEFRAGLILVLESAVRANEWLCDRLELISWLKRDDAKEMKTGNMTSYVHCVIRLIFMLAREEEIQTNQLSISATDLEYVLQSPILDFQNYTDQRILLYSLTKAGDIHLTTAAWRKYLRYRNSANFCDHDLDAKIVHVIGSHKTVSGNLVHAVCKGSRDFRDFLVQLPSEFSLEIARALNQGGVSTAVMSTLEDFSASVESTGSAGDRAKALREKGEILADVLEIVTLTMPYTSVEQYHRLLMGLTDIYPKVSALRRNQEDIAGQRLDQKSEPNDSKNAKGYHLPQRIQLIILKCFILALNGTFLDPSSPLNSAPRIFEYLLNSETIPCIAESMHMKHESSSRDEFEDDFKRFMIGAVSTFFDYVLRLFLRSGGFIGSQKLEHILELLPKAGTEWMGLAGSSSNVMTTGSYSEICRRAAAYRLLTTWTLLKSYLKDNTDNIWEKRHHIIIHVTNAASSSSTLLSSAALSLLQTIYRCLKSNSSKFALPVSESDLALRSFIHWKTHFCPQDCLDEEKKFIQVSEFINRPPSLQKCKTESCRKSDMSKNMSKSDLIASAACRTRNQTRNCYRASLENTSKSQASLSSQKGNGPPLNPDSYPTWNRNELLLGKQAVLAAPLIIP